MTRAGVGAIVLGLSLSVGLGPAGAQDKYTMGMARGT